LWAEVIAMHDFDWAAMADILELEGEAYRPYVQQALEELRQLRPRRILDVGSGPGVVACHMAAVFPHAEVIAVDGTPEVLVRAEERAKRLGVRLQTQLAEFPGGLAELPPAELIWSAQVVHHVGDQQDALNQLARLLAPGGVLAVVEGGLPARWLPRELGFGRPGLHARLDAAMEDRFSRMRAELPGSVAVVEDWASMLRAAGLTEARSKTFLVDHPAPLADGLRQSVRGSLERHRTMLGERLDTETWPRWTGCSTGPTRRVSTGVRTCSCSLPRPCTSGGDLSTDRPHGGICLAAARAAVICSIWSFPGEFSHAQLE
jgi:ubiquinone/menaquinone biosynthesis C-methylase UbiE